MKIMQLKRTLISVIRNLSHPGRNRSVGNKCGSCHQFVRLSSTSYPESDKKAAVNLTSGIVKNRLSDVNQSSSGAQDEVLVERFGKTTIIILNRPEHRNAISKSMRSKLRKAITDFENDETARVGVLCGNGGSFSSGHDMVELASDREYLEHFLRNDNSFLV